MQLKQTRGAWRHYGAPLLGLVLVVGWLGGCREKRDEIPPLSDEQYGRDFFPIAVNASWIYDVEEHRWNNNRDSVSHFQFQELVDTVFRGADGQLNYRIVRSQRPDTLTASWRADSVIAVVVNPKYVRRTFANVPMLDLVFPVQEGHLWNPNMLDAADSTSRRYEALDQPLTLPNGRSYARTVRVVDEGEDNLFKLRASSADYARGIGRVRRVRRILDFCDYNDSLQTGCSNGTGTYVVRGFERYEWLRKVSTR